MRNDRKNTSASGASRTTQPAMVGERTPWRIHLVDGVQQRRGIGEYVGGDARQRQRTRHVIVDAQHVRAQTGVIGVGGRGGAARDPVVEFSHGVCHSL